MRTDLDKYRVRQYWRRDVGWSGSEQTQRVRSLRVSSLCSVAVAPYICPNFGMAG